MAVGTRHISFRPSAQSRGLFLFEGRQNERAVLYRESGADQLEPGTGPGHSWACTEPLLDRDSCLQH